MTLQRSSSWAINRQPKCTLVSMTEVSTRLEEKFRALNSAIKLYRWVAETKEPTSKHLKGRSEPRVRHVFDSEGRSGPRDPASDTFLTRKVVRDPASDTFLTRNFRDPASDTFLTRNFRDPRPSFELAKIIFAPSKIIF